MAYHSFGGVGVEVWRLTSPHHLKKFSLLLLIRLLSTRQTLYYKPTLTIAFRSCREYNIFR